MRSVKRRRFRLLDSFRKTPRMRGSRTAPWTVRAPEVNAFGQPGRRRSAAPSPSMQPG
ncbi:hypothetical protein BSU04_24900 [Caballeronia sordidicola]|uniref:Uncharacterized protein n=1 Tax=Caballeronia sordidicola TaxID=196367 RepID=A0A226WYX4_CABSO|nr:hypothetical protein BSU04_24900 [Caballeronia sordidicola]